MHCCGEHPAPGPCAPPPRPPRPRAPPDLGQPVLRQLGDVVEVLVGGVVGVHRNHLVVLLPVVHHLHCLVVVVAVGWGVGGGPTAVRGGRATGGPAHGTGGTTPLPPASALAPLRPHTHPAAAPARACMTPMGLARRKEKGTTGSCISTRMSSGSWSAPAGGGGGGGGGRCAHLLAPRASALAPHRRQQLRHALCSVYRPCPLPLPRSQ